jgi:predicted signal transduction protein with EAL and GGDEF domain
LRSPILIGDQEYFVTASAGPAVYPDDGAEAGILKKNADMAMYKAKELGKNQVAFCTPEMKEDIEKRVLMTNLLYRAQQRDELVLYTSRSYRWKRRRLSRRGAAALGKSGAWPCPRGGLYPLAEQDRAD